MSLTSTNPRPSITVEVNGLTFSIATGEFTGRQSSIKQFEDCHRLYGWERVEGLTPESPRMPLEFGSATHIFLQERGRGIPLEAAMEAGLARLRRDFPKPIFGEDQELLEHVELARRLWPVHEAFWKDTAEDFIPLGQEVKGRVEVGNGTGVFLVFQLDRLVNFLGSFWVVDYKTMSKNDDRNFQNFEIDMQPTAYVYGASKILQKRVAGVIIDGLIKTKVPQFRREQYIRTDEQLVEFEREFPEICTEIAWRHARVAGGEDWKTVFYKNTRHCFHWGRACDFFRLCSRDSPINRMAYRDRDPDYMDDPKLLDVAGANDGVRTPKA